MMKIDARGMDYRLLNAKVKQALAEGEKALAIDNVLGQRYLGTGLRGQARITLCGVPGNDMGAFLDGSILEVMGNAQDGCGNTMRAGEIIVHGRAGDIVGLSMQGGRIFVRDEAGYRVGIHMKEYGSSRPVIVVGELTQDFVGEYMAGGIILMLNRSRAAADCLPRFIGTGMHGGVIYIRGEVEPWRVGSGAAVSRADDDDMKIITDLAADYESRFGIDCSLKEADVFSRFSPRSRRPYGNLYAG